MANPVWSLTNRTIDNRGTKSNPALTTATPTNPQGWETLRTYTDGSTVQYRIDSQGRVGYRDGRNGNQYANLQQFADQLAGEDSTSFIQNYINRLKTDITGVLTTRTQNTIPSAPPPATPTPGTTPANTPGAAAAGPNADQDPDPDLSSFAPVLGKLQTGQDKDTYGIWHYPETIGSTNQDRVFIQMLKYVLPDIAQSGTAFAGALSNRENDFATKSQILGSVTLPMTNNLTESVEVDWGSDKLSSIAAGLMAGGITVAKQIAKGDFLGALSTFGGTVGSGLENQGIAGRANQYLAAKLAAGLVSGAGFQINPEAYLTRRTGTVPNPNLELLFNGPKLKAFGLVFKLTPRSEKEAHQIRNIIKFFKKGMAPIRGNNQENSFFLGTPNVFNIQFKSSDKSSELLSLPQFKTCALVTCGVNYTPDGFYTAYNDPKAGGSQPISVTLQLGFSELTPVYNSDYEFPGDDNESVGPDRKQFERTIDNTSPPPETPPATSTGVPGNPLLTRRAGRAPVLGGPGSASRAGQTGAYTEWTEGRSSGTIPLNVPFLIWKRQKGYP
jgi:hypothetical protein